MTINQLDSYFSGLISHQNINKVVFGDVDHLLDGLPGTKTEDYPLLFIPFFSRNNDENDADYRWEMISITICIYKPWGKNKGVATQKSILAELEPIINDVAGKIWEDINEQNFPIQSDMDVKGEGPNISKPLGPNNLIGWFYEFQFMQTSQIKHDPSKWV